MTALRLNARFLSPDRALGERPLLVLGPSLGTSTALWNETAPLLADDVDLLAWDLPGHGDSPRADSTFTVGDLADAVVDLVDEHAGGVAFHYAGVSLGGATGLDLGIRHGDRLRSLTVLCSGAKLGSPDAWKDRAAQVREHGTASLVEGSVQRWFAPGFPERQPRVAETLLGALRAADDQSYALCCEALAAFDVRDDVSNIAVPTLAVAGSEDTVTPPSHATAIAEAVLSGGGTARTEVLKGVAHLAPAEAPSEVAQLLRDVVMNMPAAPRSAGSAENC